MEDELEYLTRETFLIKKGNKYETNFPIISKEVAEAIHAARRIVRHDAKLQSDTSDALHDGKPVASKWANQKRDELRSGRAKAESPSTPTHSRNYKKNHGQTNTKDRQKNAQGKAAVLTERLIGTDGDEKPLPG